MTELLAVALGYGIVGGALLASVPAALWLIYEWADELLHPSSPSERAPTPPCSQNGNDA